MTIEEKIRLIESSASFADVPAEAMPVSHRENYYFVSYSHKDYKEVLKDILRLEELGVNIWYDNEMHIGENWREIAQMYISKFQCSGVIFYLTENSISSPACNQEVEYVLTHNKNFLSINKPLDGCGIQSGYAMLKELVKRGLKCDESLLANFERAFSDEVLYLGMDESAERKASKICAIEREELLQIEMAYPRITRPGVLSVAACRDNTIISLDLSKKQEAEGLNDYISVIGDCVFTNSIKLQRVRVSPSLSEIGESAFRNCISLEKFDVSELKDLRIKSNAFKNCTALKTIDLSRVESIGERAFEGCTSLELEVLSGEIGNSAFNKTHIKRIDYVAESPYLCDSAFFGCNELEEFSVRNRFTRYFGDSVFYSCESLKRAGPFIAPWKFGYTDRKTIDVGRSCFGRCERLEEIKFEGAWSFDSAERAFDSCTSLKRMDLDIAGTVIPDYFAEGCSSLSEITNTSRFTEIGYHAFYECASLKEFDLGNVALVGEAAFAKTGIERACLKSVKRISKEAFLEAKLLKDLYIGEECEEISDSAFEGCLSLTTVRILSEKVDMSASQNVFYLTDIKTFYLRSRTVYDRIKDEGVLEHLRYLYVGENVDLSELDLGSFVREESDEDGFVKFVQERVEMPLDLCGDVDIASAEVNARDPYREKLDANVIGFAVGQEYEIKHSRLSSPHTYFIEDIAYDNGTVDYLTVSLHTGRSFKLDSSLIVSRSRVFEIEKSDIKLDDNTELDGRTCRIVCADRVIVCEVKSINVYLTSRRYPMLSAPVKDENSRYILEAVFYLEDDRMKAISALDIDTIEVLDGNNSVEKVITKENKGDLQ